MGVSTGTSLAIAESLESTGPLSVETHNAHQAIVSLMKELQAIDSYTQRADACPDVQLKKVLLHNRNEEVEHAAMLVEWIRRHDERFNTMLRTYLFTEEPITDIEKTLEVQPAGR